MCLALMLTEGLYQGLDKQQLQYYELEMTCTKYALLSPITYCLQIQYQLVLISALQMTLIAHID